MCIIVAKNKITPLPKEEYLKNCFTNNPDGAGFMYVNNNEVVIDKGYMTYKSFIKRYKKLCRKYNNFENKSLVMHFRIGTAGANSKENTHPYPVTYDKNILHKTYYRTSLGVAHNGIIHDYNPPTGTHDVNDTQNFIMKYIYPIYKHYPKFYKNQYVMAGIEEITNSKFAFLDKCDNIYLVGKFETDDSGVKYSNSNYLPYDYTWKYTNNYGYYYKNLDKYYEDKYHYDTMYDDEDFVKGYLNDKEEDKEVDYGDLYEIKLEPEWYYSVDEKNFEKVGDKKLVYDYYYDILYETNSLNEEEYIGRNVMIFDENGEEMIF